MSKATRILAALVLPLVAFSLLASSADAGRGRSAARGARIAAGKRSGPSAPTGYWTVFTPSVDTRTIYVSSSGGNDSNNGLSSGAPKATINGGAALLRDGYPDWLLFKAGDTWTVGSGNQFGDFDHKGRSSAEPMVIGSYGSGARPVFAVGTTGGPVFFNNGTNAYRDYLAFVSLDFYADQHDPGSPSYNSGASVPACITWRAGTHWVLFEDVRWRFCGIDIHQSSGGTFSIGGFRFRRCQVTDNYLTDGGSPSGIYADNISSDGLVFDESLFDYNGWRQGYYGRDIFSHNMYLDGDGSPNATDPPYLTVTNTFMFRGAANGVQLRSGVVTAVGNYLEQNAEGINPGRANYSPPYLPIFNSLVTRNTILHPYHATVPSDSPKQYGIWIGNVTSLTVSYNLVANALDSSAGDAIVHDTDADPNTVYTGNVVYNWPVGSFTSGSYTDSTRDLAAYDAHLGGPGTFDHAVTQLRAQSKASWDDNWSIQSIQTWVRAGWNLSP